MFFARLDTSCLRDVGLDNVTGMFDGCCKVRCATVDLWFLHLKGFMYALQLVYHHQEIGHGSVSSAIQMLLVYTDTCLHL
jgi:hypothetical protein